MKKSNFNGPPNFYKYHNRNSAYREELIEFAQRLFGIIKGNYNNKAILLASADLLTPLEPILDFEFPYDVGLGYILSEIIECLLDNNNAMADSQIKTLEENFKIYLETKPVKWS